ncbi:MAG: phosphoadenosine phosphosulfate reductase family protein [Candidatus Aenigmatarchaeota archaeon]
MVDERRVEESIEILSNAAAKYDNPTIAFAGGKDSTLVLYLARQSVPKDADFPFDIILIDTTYQFAETYNFIDNIMRKWGLDYDKIKNEEALNKNINPFDNEKFECCNQLKTNALKQAIEEREIDALIEGIRWDEHVARGKNIGEENNPVAIGEYLREDPEHVRVYPIQNWSEDEVWEFTKANDIPYNPLYDRDYRSIGCWPCTEPVIDDSLPERSGRDQDKEKVLERLRELGYM